MPCVPSGLSLARHHSGTVGLPPLWTGAPEALQLGHGAWHTRCPANICRLKNPYRRQLPSPPSSLLFLSYTVPFTKAPFNRSVHIYRA